MQVKALRNALHKDMSDLASMAQQQSARAADAEKRLVRSVGCGVQMRNCCSPCSPHGGEGHVPSLCYAMLCFDGPLDRTLLELYGRFWSVLGLRYVFACRDAARSQRVLAANVVRQLIRMNERYCRRALTAWRSALQAQHEKRAMLHGAIQRMAGAKLRAAWHAWAELVRVKLAVRRHHCAIVSKVEHSYTAKLLISGVNSLKWCMHQHGCCTHG